MGLEILPLFDSTTTVETLEIPLLREPIELLDDLVPVFKESVFSLLSFFVSLGVYFPLIIRVKD